MARKPITDMSAWPSLSLEGNLIAPAMIAKIDQRQAPEQSPEEYGVRKGLQIREEIATAFRVGQSHFDAFAKIGHPSAAATARSVYPKVSLKKSAMKREVEAAEGCSIFAKASKCD